MRFSGISPSAPKSGPDLVLGTPKAEEGGPSSSSGQPPSSSPVSCTAPSVETAQRCAPSPGIYRYGFRNAAPGLVVATLWPAATEHLHRPRYTQRHYQQGCLSVVLHRRARGVS
jgi:hypothetical protein